MNTIAKIFSGAVDERVHDEFIKFSKGVFNHKYLLEAKRQKQQWSIKTSAEFANYLVMKCLNLSSGPLKITGVIVATFDISKEANLPIERIKQFMGVKQAVVNAELEPRRILDLMEKFPRAFYALSFATPGFVLKIKPKAPKGAKPSAGGEKPPAAEFCSLKTSNHELVDDLFFDTPGFQEIEIRHTIAIENIILPSGVKDPVQIREQSKRQGTLKRIIILDGKTITKETKFEA